jgi:large subunit ribosomal protein L10
MSTNKQKKKVVIDATLERFKDASGIIITDYQGLKVTQVNDLRRKLEKAGASYKVIKNTLTKRVIDDLKIDASLKPLFRGVTGLVFCKDYMAAIKVLTAFGKANEKFKIKGGYIESKAVTLAEITALSNVPSKPELLAKFVILLNSPIQRLVNVLDRASKKEKETEKTDAPKAEAVETKAAEAPAAPSDAATTETK